MQSHFNTFTQEEEEEEELWVSGFHRVPSWVTTAEPGDVGFDPAAFCMPTQGSNHILSGHASAKLGILIPHISVALKVKVSEEKCMQILMLILKHLLCSFCFLSFDCLCLSIRESWTMIWSKYRVSGKEPLEFLFWLADPSSLQRKLDHSV